MRIALWVGLIILGILLLWAGLNYAGYYVSAARRKHIPLAVGSVAIPHERTYTWQEGSPLRDEVFEHWASQDIPDWKEKGKVTVPRVLLGKLVLRRDIERVNTFLQSLEPRGNSGSKWALHPEGDYDFTLAGLIPILYLFGDEPEVLYPKTCEHLLSVLLTNEGPKPRVTVPRTLGLVRDTENHLLMAEGSRYLKNRWMYTHGNKGHQYDNRVNGLESWLLSLLTELREAGLYEFNSMPYLGYTMTALMNLEAFGSEVVGEAARNVLDQLNWKYALGSLSLRRYAPFRRQLGKASVTSLNNDYQTAMMKVWMSLRRETSLDLTLNGGHHHALWASMLRYRLPDQVADWVERKPSPYFVRFGHGPGASPEIYSGGPGYLLSAGGVHRGKRSMIVARPITLILADEALDLAQCFHLAGPGDDFREWNNTGVHRDFACTAGPVHVPEGWRPAAESDGWSIYRSQGNLSIAVHSRPDLGILCLSRKADPSEILAQILAANPDQTALSHTFQQPDGLRLTYDVAAPKDRWVITSVNGRSVEREHARWARIDGEL